MGSTLEEYNSIVYDYISTKVEQNVTRDFQAYTILLLFHTKIPNSSWLGFSHLTMSSSGYLEFYCYYIGKTLLTSKIRAE